MQVIHILKEYPIFRTNTGLVNPFMLPVELEGKK